MALTRNCSRRHTPIAKGLYQAGYIHGGYTHPLLKPGAKEIKICIIKRNWIQAWDRFGWCQAEADKIKIYQEQAELIQGLK